MRHTHWHTFLRIPEFSPDLAPELDAGWCAMKGVNTGSPIVLGLIRDEVVPLVTSLRALARYWFLVHNRESGVPTTADDKSGYVHLSLVFKKPVLMPRLSRKWTMTRPFELPKTVAGLNRKVFVRPRELEILLADQSAWLSRLVLAHREDTDLATLVRQVRQYLHYFANMAQMTVQ